MSNEKKNDGEFSFIKEKIKDKPLNKKKLVVKAGCCVAAAIVFGCVASLSFVLSKPYFEQAFAKEEEPDKVSIPQDEDSVETDAQVKEPEPEPEAVQPKEPPIVISQEVDLGIEDYKTLYQELNAVAREAERFIVTVTGVTSKTDWFNETLESQGQASGIIAANNGQELLILTSHDVVETAEKLMVSFTDGTVADAEKRKYDGNTGISVISVPLSVLSEETMERIKIAELGNSYAASKGDLMLAVGSPLGYSDSMAHGILTSTTKIASTVDANYRVLTTDAVGSGKGSGAIINMAGQVIGFIAPRFNPDPTTSMVTGLAISDLKSVVSRLLNNRDIVCLGIRGSEVTETIAKDQSLPVGVYVTEVMLDSPAMSAGIQNGDVIVKIDEAEIRTLRDFHSTLDKCEPNQPVTVTAMRQGIDGHKEIQIPVTLGQMK